MVRFWITVIVLVLAEREVIGVKSGHGVPGGDRNWNNSSLVTTKYGQLKGFTDKGSTWCWKGVPYAAPPVDSLRWKAPVDPLPWTGVRTARKFGSSASQFLPVLGYIGSEDCLYLNIWRPKGDEIDLPVYLFIHGGGNSLGTASSPDYSGHVMAGRSGIIFISVNYRLGVMGWFRHPAVTSSGSPEDQSGNFATLDLLQALKWVRDNIQSFGGDPHNVTIAGESAGAINVLSLLISPAAKGLFHRAVSESGLALARTTREAEAASSNLLMNLSKSDGRAAGIEEARKLISEMSDQDIEKYLRSKTAFELMKNIPHMVAGMADWPAIYTDGSVLPAEGYNVLANGTWANKVPLLIGINKDEAALFRYMAKNPEPGTRRYELLSRYQTLIWRVGGLDSIAMGITLHDGAPPVYAYRFDWGSADENGNSVLPGKMGKDLGSHHYAEIPFFLGTGKSQLAIITGRPFTNENRQGREKLTNLCMDYVANFARTGNPNSPGLPVWDGWNPDPGAGKFIILDADFENLRISWSNEALTMDSLILLAESELTGPEKDEILKILRRKLLFAN